MRMLAISPSQPRPQSTMFRRLFSYLGGENQEGQKMEMTTPVWTKLVVSDEVTDCTDEIIIVPHLIQEGQITSTMCVSISRQFQSNPPEPLESEVKIVRRSEKVVFVKEFGGFAMQDWVLIRQAQTFRAELGEKTEKLELGHFWAASYDSPVKFWNRKNEVAFEKL